MLPQSKGARRFLSGAAVLAASVLSVLVARGHYEPYTADAPPYRMKGPASARVDIVEFSDFQCPACAGGSRMLRRLLGVYGQDVRVIYKHRPLQVHGFAREAAAAAECAGKQGEFWTFHDLLFDRQHEWIPYAQPGNKEGPPPREWFLKYAGQTGLDVKTFTACLADPAVAAAVEADAKEADGQLVNATPTFFVAGKRLVGGHQLTVRGSIRIDRLLKEAK